MMTPHGDPAIHGDLMMTSDRTVGWHGHIEFITDMDVYHNVSNEDYITM